MTLTDNALVALAIELRVENAFPRIRKSSLPAAINHALSTVSDPAMADNIPEPRPDSSGAEKAMG